MNFIRGIANAGVLNGPEFTIEALPVSCTGPVILGIRPEYVSLVDHSEADIVAPVYAVEFMGQSTMATVLIAGEQLSFMLTAAVPLQVGSPVGLKFDRSQMFLFDEKTESRIR